MFSVALNKDKQCNGWRNGIKLYRRSLPASANAIYFSHRYVCNTYLQIVGFMGVVKN